MKKLAVCCLLALLLGAFLGIPEASALSKAEVAQQRAEINRLHDETLQRLYEKKPAAKRVLRNCYAYATLSNSGVKVLLFGSARGRGMAVNNATGEKVYLKMKEVAAGFGLGAKEYDLVFVIDNKAAWDSFIIGKTRFAGSAEATAKDGVNGDGAEGADYVADGVWVYQMTKKGLALEISLKGTKIYEDKNLN